MDLRGKKILITAGPTHEKIDPVRFIGNYSTGKMGFELARVAISLGAELYLVAGPVWLDTPKGCVRRVDVVSAAEMYEASLALFPDMDIAIMCAAVADFTPIEVATTKRKRAAEDLILHLRPTQDIAAALGEIKRQSQLLVGFALESDHEMDHAQQKLVKKNLDAIVLNSLRNEGTCFGSDYNQITLLTRNGAPIDFQKKPKQEVAIDIMTQLMTLLG